LQELYRCFKSVFMRVETERMGGDITAEYKDGQL
jgi:hypothetical protein